MYSKWSTVFLIKVPFLYEHLNGHINRTSSGNFNQSFTAFSFSRLWLPDQVNFQPKRVSGFHLRLGRTLALFWRRLFTRLSWSSFVLPHPKLCFLRKMTIENISQNFWELHRKRKQWDGRLSYGEKCRDSPLTWCCWGVRELWTPDHRASFLQLQPQTFSFV